MSDSHSVDNYSDWIIPDFGNIHNPPVKKSSGHALPTAEDIENIYQAARKEGFDNGFTAGMEAASKEVEATVRKMHDFMQILQDPYKHISDEVIDNIKHISLIIARQIIRREISRDEKNIIAAIKQSLSLIEEIDKPVAIHINPKDMATVNEYLNNIDGPVKFVEDITISPGGCKVDTSKSIIDATIESQITEIAVELIGGSRMDDD